MDALWLHERRRPLFLIAPLVLVPLGYRLLKVAVPGSRPTQVALRMVLPAAGIPVVSFWLPSRTDSEPRIQDRGGASADLDSAVDLLAKCAEDLELDPVLGPAGGALHIDQVG